MFKIEKGIEAPKSRVGRYPWNEMEVGDSFLVPCRDDEKRVVQTKLCGASSNRRKFGERYRAAQAEGGVRIWRVK